MLDDSPERLHDLVAESDAAGIESLIAEMAPSDAVRAILRLSHDEQEMVL